MTFGMRSKQRNPVQHEVLILISDLLVDGNVCQAWGEHKKMRLPLRSRISKTKLGNDQK